MNALLDKNVIAAFYRASQAGVEIDLLVRGMCALRPGIRGVSDPIRVRSVVGRFLEHSRVFYFANGGEEEAYLSSADWMPRNLYERVEVMFPVKDPMLRNRSGTKSWTRISRIPSKPGCCAKTVLMFERGRLPGSASPRSQASALRIFCYHWRKEKTIEAIPAVSEKNAISRARAPRKERRVS